MEMMLLASYIMRSIVKLNSAGDGLRTISYPAACSAHAQLVIVLIHLTAKSSEDLKGTCNH